MKWWRDRWPLMAAGLILLFVVVERVRLLSTPLERDEGEFAYAGQLLLQGIPPYSLCYSMKLPGMAVANAVIMGIFGQSDVAIHLGAMIVNLTGVALLYWIARRFLEPSGAALAAAIHALLTFSPGVYGFAAHATQFVIVAALAGLALLWKAVEKNRGWIFFASGVFFGGAFLLKQPGAAFGLFGLAILVWLAARDRENLARHAQSIALFVLGGLGPCAMTAAWLWHAGVFDRFWFWTVTYAQIHGSEMTGAEGARHLWDYVKNHADRWAWIAGALSVWVVFSNRMRGRWLALWFAGFSAAAVSAGFYFTGHYFVLLIPALSLFIGAALEKALNAENAATEGLAILGVAGICLTVVWRHPGTFFEYSPEQAVKSLYFGNPFVECKEIGRYLREHSEPGDKIAVVGSEPEILFYARRRSATGYIYMYDMTENLPTAKPMAEEYIAQMEKTKPEFLIFARDNFSLYATENPRRLSDTPLKDWSAKIARGYDPAGLVLVRLNPEYYWGSDAFNRPPQAEPFISILRRRK